MRRFAIYQLRSGYLNAFKDGIGERLINLDPAVFNDPAFRAAGWTVDPADLKRTYSPPIPTTIASEYFQAPSRTTVLSSDHAEEEEGTLLTGQGSNDTIGPTLGARSRRKKEAVEEDDSSELSDDSEEDEDKRAARQIKFNRMPVRIRAGSSPARPSKLKEQINEDDVTPSNVSTVRPSYNLGARFESSSTIGTIKQRVRRDTATSSEMSSENEDSIIFRRQKLNTRAAARRSMLLTDTIQEEAQQVHDSDLDDDDLSGAFDISDIDDTTEMLLGIGATLAAVDTLGSSPLPPNTMNIPNAIQAPIPPNIPAAIPAHGLSPRKRKEEPPELPRLPNGRPISFVQPVGLLSKALKTGPHGATDLPTQKFATLYGKAETNPLWIKVMFPHSAEPEKHIELPTKKAGDHGPVTVADFIGLGLWRYGQEAREPALTEDELDLNRWMLRMVDFGEVEYDFPALGRTRAITEFTTKNNKPGRLRPGQKPWDEFAIVRASETEFTDNEKITPQIPVDAQRSISIAPSERFRIDAGTPTLRQGSDVLSIASFNPARNPITGSTFTLGAMRNNSVAHLLDLPSAMAQPTRGRTGIPKTLQINFTNMDSLQTTVLEIQTTTDTYVAEVFRQACEKLKITNKALYVLKVHGTNMVVPEDRTVEALANSTSLDMQRRRFIGVEDRDGASSPTSESPNAPLVLTGTTTPTKVKKKGFQLGGGSSANQKPSFEVGAIGFHQLGPGGKRYHVLRRQPLSFAPAHPKVIALDGEYIHIMPATNVDMDAVAGGKTTSVHFKDVIGCKVARKHPKLVRVLVYREKETKKYEFDAGSSAEAAEIVEEIQKGVERFGGH